MKRIITIICLFISILSFKKVYSQSQNKKPNIILVLSDQWRRQALGSMGEDPVFTPNLDKAFR